MKRNAPYLFFLFSGIFLLTFGCATGRYGRNDVYVPDDVALYDSIVRMDSAFFSAYNTCDLHLAEYAAFYADDVEFYHDKGGLMTSKPELVESTRKNVCGKVTRESVPGSIEVYPVPGFGAVEIGYHRFHNKEEKKPSRAGRFVIVWQRTAAGWLITRVISLH